MSVPFVKFKPAQYYKGKDCYVGYYAEDPITHKLRRLKIRINHIASARERAKFASHLVHALNEKLYSGWNPFVEEYSKNAAASFNDACEAFMRDKSDLRPDSLRSYKSYTNIIVQWAADNGVGVTYCFQFDKHAAKRFMLHLASDGRKSARTYNNYLRHYQTMFSWLVDNDFIKENPFKDIKPKKEDQKMRKTVPADVRKRILAYFTEKQMYEYIVMMNLCYKCFIRPKEISMLKICHINYESMVLDLPPEITKNHNERIIPIPEDMRPFFESIRGSNHSSYIFSTGFKPGKKRMSTHAIDNVWSKMRDDLNLPSCYVFYSLKDTGITEMLEAGAPAKIVKELADHHSFEMTEKYTHRSDAKKILEWNRLEF